MSAPTTASILIVNYNYGRYLADAIDSALGQTWPTVQVVVVDDGSTDESPLIMQTYGDAITAVYKENGGQASGVNVGLPLLTGEVAILLDSDDVLESTAIEKTIGFFADPDVVKVGWPFTIIDEYGVPTGEIRNRGLPDGDLRRNALRVGPASHFTSAHSGNFWRRSFLDAVAPFDEVDFRNVVDSYLFTFSPFFGTIRAYPEPLTRYREHPNSVSSGLLAYKRREHWEVRARYLHAWLTEQGETVSIEHWRKNNPYYRRLDGIVKGEAKIGVYLPKDAPLALVGNSLYGRSDIHPFRPVHRPPDSIRDVERTEEDFREFLAGMDGAELEYIAVQGRLAWNDTNLGLLVELIRAEHEVLYEDDYIVIARLRSGSRSERTDPELTTAPV